jgi:predicted permease
MEGMWKELRVAARSLAGSPGLAVLAIATLALGIGANTAIFSVINGSLFAPLPYADPDRLVWLSDGHDNFGGAGVDQSLPNLEDLRAGSSLLDRAAIYNRENSNLATAERPERVRVLRVTSEMLGVLGVLPRLGRDFLAEEDLAGSAPVTILTDGIWRTRFGADPGIVGRTTTVDASPVEVVGVLPPDFYFPGAPDILMPLQHVGAEIPRGTRNYNAVGRLAPGAGLQGLRQELQGLFDRLVEEYPDQNEGWFTWADPMRDFVSGRSQRSLYLLAGGVALVLLIACVNVANLLVVRAERRHREFAVRYALGASRRSLLPHFLGEGVMLSLAGGALGALTAYWGVDLLVALYGDALRRPDQISLSGTVLAFTLLTSLAVGALVGLIPMARARPLDLRDSLKEGARGASGRGSRVGRALVMAEVSLAVLLVVGAGLLTNSLWRLQRVELGVAEPDRVLTFRVALPAAKYEAPEEMTAFFDALVDEVGRLPGVQAAGLVNRLPLLGGYNTTNFPAVGEPDRVAHFVSIRSVTPGYFDAVGLPLVAGRWLDATEFADEDVVSILINETLARQLFGTEDPLGRMVGPGWVEGGLRVVGVVGDLAGGDPTRPPPPAFYFPRVANPNRNMSALVRSAGDPYSLLTAIRRTVATLDPEIPVFGEATLEEIARDRLGTRRFAMSLFGVFAALALVLGAVGIYGVMSVSVSQRNRELGVRLALGATRGSVLRLVLGQGLRVTFPGVLLGLGLSLFAARVLGSLLYEVSPLDPLTYGVVAMTLTLVAVAATGLPAYRATRVDPNVSMRSE